MYVCVCVFSDIYVTCTVALFNPDKLDREVFALKLNN